MCDRNIEAIRLNEAVEDGLRALRERERVLADLRAEGEPPVPADPEPT